MAPRPLWGTQSGARTLNGRSDLKAKTMPAGRCALASFFRGCRAQTSGQALLLEVVRERVPERVEERVRERAEERVGERVREGPGEGRRGPERVRREVK